MSQEHKKKPAKAKPAARRRRAGAAPLKATPPAAATDRNGPRDAAGLSSPFDGKRLL